MKQHGPLRSRTHPSAAERTFKLASRPLLEMRGPANSWASLLLAVFTLAYVLVAPPIARLLRRKSG